TDPDANYGRTGWYDPRNGEIGDVTENNPNALVRLSGYLVQEVADRNDQLLSLTAISPSTPTTPVGVTATSTSLTASAVTHHTYRPPTAILTVVVAPNSGTVAPSGWVELMYNGSVLGEARVRVVNGVATATFNLEFFGTG